jgi:hypothetical protein
MHIILVATRTSGETSEVRSLRVHSVRWATKPYPLIVSIHCSTLSTSRNLATKPYPLTVSIHYSTLSTSRNLAAALWDLGCGPTVNQAPNESSHNDSPIMPTQQICKHRPLLPLILHKITFCCPPVKCKANPHRHTFPSPILTFSSTCPHI